MFYILYDQCVTLCHILRQFVTVTCDVTLTPILSPNIKNKKNENKISLLSLTLTIMIIIVMKINTNIN